MTLFVFDEIEKDMRLQLPPIFSHQIINICDFVNLNIFCFCCFVVIWFIGNKKAPECDKNKGLHFINQPFFISMKKKERHFNVFKML